MDLSTVRLNRRARHRVDRQPGHGEPVSTQQAIAEPVARRRADSAGASGRVRLVLASRADVLVLLVVFLLGLGYEWHFLFRGWVPWDEGALADSASRILEGQLPHRDFMEIYTGGLSYLHGFAFVLFGEELSSMRLILFAFFAVWIPVLYGIARRFAPAPVAGACVCASVVWSLPNYSASMPSWYNLFFATFSIAALFRYLDNRRTRWLVVAGLGCGLSILIKSTGIYVVAALSLVLLFDEQSRAKTSARAQRLFSGFVFAVASASVSFLVVILHRRLGAAEAVNFLLPGSCIAAFLVWNEARMPCAPASARCRSFRPARRFALGVSLPLLLFMSPYIISGSFGAFVDGVIIQPAARLEFAALKPLTLSSLPITLFVLAAFIGLGYAFARGTRSEQVATAALFVIWLSLTKTSLGYQITWTAVRDASLLLVPLGTVLLAARIRRGAFGAAENVRALTLLAVFAFATVIQFPWSGPTYFYYVAPLMFVAVLAVAHPTGEPTGAVFPPAALGVLFLFLAAFGVIRVNEVSKGGRESIGAGVPLGVPHSGSLRVSPTDNRLYRRVVARIREANASSYIYAGPDAPEVYVLADRLNPTRAAYDFFERDPAHDRRLLRALDEHRVSLVALNLQPSFSPPLDSRLRVALAVRYPHHERIGRFELRWRR